MSDSHEFCSERKKYMIPEKEARTGSVEDGDGGRLEDSEASVRPTFLEMSLGSETIDVNQLLPPEVTNSGSYDLRGTIWTTTFGKLVQALPLMAFVIDRSHNIVAANQSCSKLGSHYSKTIGTLFSSLVSDRIEAEKVEKALESVFLTRKQNVCQVHMSTADANVWGRITLRSVRIGTERLVMAFVEDLTSEREKLMLQQRLNEELTQEVQRRRKAEEDFARSERRYRQVVEAAEDAIFTTDAGGRFTYLNPVILSKLGYTADEILGQHYLMMVHADHSNASREFYSRQFHSRISHTYYELPVIAKDGTTFWIGQNVHLLSEGDNVIGFQSIARDITARKIAEHRLKASLKEKEVLMREIHHRVKNNFQVISSLLTLQSSHAEDNDSLELLTSANARIMAMALVHEKLYESTNLAEIRIDEYVGDLVDYFMGFAQDSAAGIARRVDVEELYFGPDAAIPIGLIITELLTNAMKHAFPKGRGGEVTVSLRSAGENQFELLVSDNGIGLPSGIDLGNTKTLGLGLVSALARKLRGAVRVNTSNGSTFFITFKDLENRGGAGNNESI